MSRKKTYIPATGPIKVLSAHEATKLAMPKFNAYACGHGIHGDVKYNRARAKRAFRLDL